MKVDKPTDKAMKIIILWFFLFFHNLLLAALIRGSWPIKEGKKNVFGNETKGSLSNGRVVICVGFIVEVKWG